MLSRVINLLGVPLPRSADLGVGQAENPANPRGFWEPRLLVLENERLLNRCGAKWSAPPPMSYRWGIDLSPSLYQRALIRYHRREPAWVWKDPRLCLTLDFWKPLLDRCLVVILLRNPEAVMESLHRRDGFSEELGYALWEQYVLSSLRVAQGLPFTVVHHEKLIAKPVDVATEIADWLARNSVEVEVQADRIYSFVDPALTDDSTASKPVPRWIASLYEELMGLGASNLSLPTHIDLSPEASEILERRRQEAVAVGFRSESAWRARILRAWIIESLKRFDRNET